MKLAVHYRLPAEEAFHRFRETADTALALIGDGA
jgi:hypothetical protein